MEAGGALPLAGRAGIGKNTGLGTIRTWGAAVLTGECLRIIGGLP